MPGDNPSPTIDFVFRKLFGSEENKDLLISLINSIVEPDFHVTDLVIKNPFNLAAYLDAKETIVDIKAQDQDGLWYDIEMQVIGHIFYGKRAIYYLSKIYADQLPSGREFSKLNPTIGIHFLDFNVFNDPRMVRRFVFKDAETNEDPDELKDLQIYIVEMGKLNKEWSETSTIREKWVAFLKQGEALHRSNLPTNLGSEPAIAKAVAELERMGSDRTAREIYEAEEKARMVDTAMIQYAEERAEKRGEARGEARGKRETILLLGTKLYGEPDTIALSRLNEIDSLERLSGLALRVMDVHSWTELLS
jgi:predicted transposase/invertase (TIGR01784 family)